MKKEIEALKANFSLINNKQNIHLSSAILQQNIPNPVSNNTSITYNIPGNVKYAEIVITDKVGKKIKNVQINGTGNGVIEVNTAALATGTYQYSLFINGSLAESKQMIISR